MLSELDQVTYFLYASAFQVRKCEGRSDKEIDYVSRPSTSTLIRDFPLFPGSYAGRLSKILIEEIQRKF